MDRRKPTQLKKWVASIRNKRIAQTVFREEAPSASENVPLSRSLEGNLAALQETLGRSSDVFFRRFRLKDGRDACLIYVGGLSDLKQMDADLLLPLTERAPGAETDGSGAPKHLMLDDIARALPTSSELHRLTTVQEIEAYVMVEISIALLIDHEPIALGVNMNGEKDRAIEEPSTESVIRGPHEGFNENLSTSLSLIRRRVRTSRLIVETMKIGTYTHTKVAMCYIKDIIDASLVDEMRHRLERIETDSIIDAGYIEEFIEDDPYSPFPQVQNTERPDVAAAALVEGRVILITNGSPFALIAPINLWGAIQAAEDYYERYPIANLIRLLRYIFLFIALYLPSLYVAITTFHQEMLPTKLLISIAAAREVTPFPALVEALLMEVTFEALREAGIRLPKTVGSAISIVGALVIGQAAVQAGVVSATMVIVVAITGIASFVIPRYSFAIAIRMLRFGMMLLAGTLGLFGIIIGTLMVLIHLGGLRSLGVPYLQPLSPLHLSNLSDVFTRPPHWVQHARPVETSKLNTQRRTPATSPKHRVPTRKRES